MNGQNNENLKDLFERFLSAEQAERSVEDIQKAEQILHNNPAPEPDSMLIADIKAEIAMRLPAERPSIFMKVAYRAAYIAAAILIISAISLSLFDKNIKTTEPLQRGSILPAAVWDSDDITTDDAELAIYTMEIEQIEEELRSLKSGEDAGNGSSTISEIEMELVAINNDFWKE